MENPYSVLAEEPTTRKGLKLRIVSDGTLPGTSVVNEEGEKVEGVTEIYFALNVKENISSAVIHLTGVPVSLVHHDMHCVVDQISNPQKGSLRES